jgi:hypothetical protein
MTRFHPASEFQYQGGFQKHAENPKWNPCILLLTAAAMQDPCDQMHIYTELQNLRSRLIDQEVGVCMPINTDFSNRLLLELQNLMLPGPKFLGFLAVVLHQNLGTQVSRILATSLRLFGPRVPAVASGGAFWCGKKQGPL